MLSGVSGLMKHNQTLKSPFYSRISLLIDVFETMAIKIHHTPNHHHKPWAARFPSCSWWAVRYAVPTGMTAELQPADVGGGPGGSLSVRTSQIHWFLCPVINGASLCTQTVEKSSWQAEARRVLGLHFVIMVIWELKFSPLLAIEGCWYLVSAPRNLCMCHRLHFRLISDWT